MLSSTSRLITILKDIGSVSRIHNGVNYRGVKQCVVVTPGNVLNNNAIIGIIIGLTISRTSLAYNSFETKLNIQDHASSLITFPPEPALLAVIALRGDSDA